MTSAVRAAVQEYAARFPELEAATTLIVEQVTTLLDDARVNYLTISGRTKSVMSFAGKAHRTLDGSLLFADPLNDITDQIGVRVIAYLASDVAAVADLITDHFTLLDDRDMGRETAQAGEFGYSSRHLLLATELAAPARSAQVQVRTVLQHAWAEFEHDIRYKGSIPPEHAPDLDRRFTLAAGLLELADREFSEIRELVSSHEFLPLSDRDEDDPRISGPDLASFLSATYADSGWSRTNHYTWIGGLLLELGVDSLDELATILEDVDPAAIDTTMGYAKPPGAVRRLDDALLWLYGERYLNLHGNAHRIGLLRARLAKLHPGG